MKKKKILKQMLKEQAVKATQEALCKAVIEQIHGDMTNFFMSLYAQLPVKGGEYQRSLARLTELLPAIEKHLDSLNKADQTASSGRDEAL